MYLCYIGRTDKVLYKTAHWKDSWNTSSSSKTLLLSKENKILKQMNKTYSLLVYKSAQYLYTWLLIYLMKKKNKDTKEEK